MSPLVLTLLYALHILATVVWIGGLTALILLVLPAARRSLPGEQAAALMRQINIRLQRVGWLCLLVLIGTGMFQMSANPNYQGFLAIDNSWSMAILLKHIAIGLMVLAAAYLTWGLMPRLERLALLRHAGRPVDAAEEARLQRREELWLRISLGLSALVLVLTAWARAAG